MFTFSAVVTHTGTGCLCRDGTHFVTVAAASELDALLAATQMVAARGEADHRLVTDAVLEL